MSAEAESIFERISRYNKPSSSLPSNGEGGTTEKEGRKTAMIDYGNPRGWYGAKASTVVACQNDDEVVRGVVEHVEGHDLVFARFMELGNVQGCKCLSRYPLYKDRQSGVRYSWI